MVAQKVTSRVVVLVDCMPTTAGTLACQPFSKKVKNEKILKMKRINT